MHGPPDRYQAALDLWQKITIKADVEGKTVGTCDGNGKEGGGKGWLHLRWHNWHSAPHLVGKLDIR